MAQFGFLVLCPYEKTRDFNQAADEGDYFHRRARAAMVAQEIMIMTRGRLI